MTKTAEDKLSSIDHVEDSHTPPSLDHGGGLQPSIEEAQEKYHVPVREVLAAHLDEDPKIVRRIRWKVDLRLVPMLSLLYMWAFIDRSNLGNVWRSRPTRLHELIVSAGEHCWNEHRS